MRRRRFGAAVLVLLAVGMLIPVGKGAYVRFVLLGKDAPVSVSRRDSSMTEPVQVSREDARRTADIITRNGFSYRLGTSDSIGIFQIHIGDRVFSCDEDGCDLNDHGDNLHIQITYGREELLDILLKYTQAYMP